MFIDTPQCNKRLTLQRSIAAMISYCCYLAWLIDRWIRKTVEKLKCNGARLIHFHLSYSLDSSKLEEMIRSILLLCHMTVVEAKHLALSALRLITFLSFSRMKKLQRRGTLQEESLVVALRLPKKLFTSSLLLVRQLNCMLCFHKLFTQIFSY